MPRLNLRINRRGLTLVELLVTMILLSIVGSALTRVLVKQQQAYRDASRTAEARRELQMAATMMPAEIRSISTAGGDIIDMSESQITMRGYVGTGVLCDRTSAGDRFWLPPENLSHGTLTSFASPPMIGDTIFLFNDGNDRGAVDDVWEKRVVSNIGPATMHCLGAPYTDPALDPVSSKPRLRIHVTVALPDSVKPGSVVRFTRPMRYLLYQVGSGAWYLGVKQYYGGTWNEPDPLAGPFRPFVSGDGNPSGLQFRFYDTLGTRITDMTQTKSVARIDLYLRTNAGTAAVTERNGNLLRDSVLMRIGIRNNR